MTSSIKDKVKNKLEEYGIEIFKEFKYEDEEVIMANDLTITCKKNEIFVSFHLTSKVSYACRVTLILKEIEGIKDFYIGEDFIFDEDGKFIDGNDAYKYHEKFLKKSVIDKFMEQQSQIYYLNKANSYHC